MKPWMVIMEPENALNCSPETMSSARNRFFAGRGWIRPDLGEQQTVCKMIQIVFN